MPILSTVFRFWRAEAGSHALDGVVFVHSRPTDLISFIGQAVIAYLVPLMNREENEELKNTPKKFEALSDQLLFLYVSEVFHLCLFVI